MAQLTNNVPKHTVSVNLGMTVNLGDFESLRIDIGLEVEGKDGESPTQTYERAYKWVEDRLAEKVEEARK